MHRIILFSVLVCFSASSSSFKYPSRRLQDSILDKVFDCVSNHKDYHHKQHASHSKPHGRNPSSIPTDNFREPNKRILISLPYKQRPLHHPESIFAHKTNDPEKETPEQHMENSRWITLKRDPSKGIGSENLVDLSEVQQLFTQAAKDDLPKTFRDFSAETEKYEGDSSLWRYRSLMAHIQGKDKELVGKGEIFNKPYNAVGMLSHGTAGARCTGTFIGPRHILTAAHCVYNSAEKKWEIPFRFNLQKGCEEDPASQYYWEGVSFDWEMVIIPKGYTISDHSDPVTAKYDYAMLVIRESIYAAPMMNFGWNEAPDSELLKGPLPVGVIGYPDGEQGDKRSCMWKYNGCTLSPPTWNIYTSSVLSFNRKCPITEGASGGPVYQPDSNGVPTVYCIVSSESRPGDPRSFTFCVRISKLLFVTFRHWMEVYSGERESLKWVVRTNDAGKTVSESGPSQVDKVVKMVADNSLPYTYNDLSSAETQNTPKALKGRTIVMDDSGRTNTKFGRIVNGLSTTCTGTLIGPRHVLTAASCLYDTSSSTWFDDFQFQLGKNCDPDKGTEFTWEMVIVPKAYVTKSTDHPHQFDFGLLVLNTKPSSPSMMNFGWDPLVFSLLNSMPSALDPVKIVGYPKNDESFGCMQEGTCKFQSMHKKQIDLLQHSCPVDDGDRGSPLFTVNPMVVKCVQVEWNPKSLPAKMYCLAITKKMFSLLVQWIRLYP